MLYRIAMWAALPAVLFCGRAAAQTPCSIETVRGVWMWSTGVGTRMTEVAGSAQPMALPEAWLGMYTIDDQGRISGWANGMVAGQYIDHTVAGVVEVNPNCTGTVRFRVMAQGAPAPMPGEAVSRIVVVDGGNEMKAMTITPIGGKVTGMETYRRIVRNSRAAPKCTAETVRGTYGTAVEAVVLMPAPAPYSGIGAFAVDSRGEITGGSTISVAGQVMEAEVVECRLQVLEDCTGYLTYRSKPKGAAAPGPGALDKVVILDDGEEIRGLNISAAMKTVMPESWKRISKELGPVGW